MNSSAAAFGAAMLGGAFLICTAPIASATPVVDRIDITTWAYDRVEGDVYTADNAGGKALTVYWKTFSGEKQVRSGCTSTVEISGPGYSESKNQDSCDSYNPGTSLKIKRPGEYTVTVTVRQDGQPDLSAELPVTIRPHG